MTIRVGLVGAGPWATMFHAPMLAAASRLELAAVWARRPGVAKELAGRFGVDAAASFEDLLDRCDAVAFAVPPYIQADLAVRAAEAGRHLLLEKPLATTLDAAKRVAAAADRSNVRSQLVLTIRYRSSVRAFLRGIVPGRVSYVRASYLGGGGLAGSPFATTWRQGPDGGLLDIGPHTVDLVEAVAGPITEVRAAAAGGVTTAETVHRQGARGQLALSITVPMGPGGVDLDAVTDSGLVTMPGGPTDDADVWRTITDEFATAVERGEPHPLDVHHGVRLQRVLDAIAHSVETGQSVELRPEGRTT
jgi:predicted dehydrogenase